MRERGPLSRWGPVVLFASLAFGATGCQTVQAVGNYFVYRYNDFGEMVDMGLTITTTPQIGLYWNSLEVLVAGYSNVDGYFVGLGGGQIGVTRHYNNCYGLGMSVEKVGWGSGLDSENREDYISERKGGILGMLVDLAVFPYEGAPDYTFS
ncbi:MAG: hypothetical protein HY812_16930 [Planctomycetes bacterium]|nr:hypothetical protein [Planctomycetota bacterium]